MQGGKIILHRDGLVGVLMVEFGADHTTPKLKTYVIIHSKDLQVFFAPSFHPRVSYIISRFSLP